MTIRVLVVDDSLTIRAMVEQVLKGERELEVVGLACNAQEAEACIGRLHPDVITLDIAMPGMDGLQFLTDVMEHHPRPVVMVSSLTGAGAAACEEALARGAVSCFHKSHIVSKAKDFIKTIKAAHRVKQTQPQRFYHKTCPN